MNEKFIKAVKENTYRSTEPTHTPTPWGISQYPTDDTPRGVHIRASNGTGRHICVVTVEGDDWEQARETASLIVRAVLSANEKRSEAPVNSYEAMKEALELALEQLQPYSWRSEGDRYAFNAIKQALALTHNEGKAVQK
jgi:hypothetical protein